MEKFCLASKMSWLQLSLVFFHLGTHILGLIFLAKNLYWKLLSWLVHSIGVKPPWKISVWEKVVLETVSCKIPSWNKGWFLRPFLKADLFWEPLKKNELISRNSLELIKKNWMMQVQFTHLHALLGRLWLFLHPLQEFSRSYFWHSSLMMSGLYVCSFLCATNSHKIPLCCEYIIRLYFSAHHFCPKRKMFTFSRAHSHALTNATRHHEYFRGLSRLLPVPGVLVSISAFIFS